MRRQSEIPLRVAEHSEAFTIFLILACLDRNVHVPGHVGNAVASIGCGRGSFPGVRSIQNQNRCSTNSRAGVSVRDLSAQGKARGRWGRGRSRSRGRSRGRGRGRGRSLSWQCVDPPPRRAGNVTGAETVDVQTGAGTNTAVVTSESITSNAEGRTTRDCTALARTQFLSDTAGVGHRRRWRWCWRRRWRRRWPWRWRGGR